MTGQKNQELYLEDERENKEEDSRHWVKAGLKVRLRFWRYLDTSNSGVQAVPRKFDQNSKKSINDRLVSHTELPYAE